jgi:hypothetical protein
VQSYLTNESCVDSVYRAILARACAEPQRCAELYMHKLLPSLAEAIAIANLAVLLLCSEAVIAKCIALIKQYASRCVAHRVMQKSGVPTSALQACSTTGGLLFMPVCCHINAVTSDLYLCLQTLSIACSAGGNCSGLSATGGITAPQQL